jgi:hypothetical protein
MVGNRRPGKRRRGISGGGGSGGRGFAVGDVPELKLKMVCFCSMSLFSVPRYAGSTVSEIALICGFIASAKACATRPRIPPLAAGTEKAPGGSAGR